MLALFEILSAMMAIGLFGAGAAAGARRLTDQSRKPVSKAETARR